MRLCLLVKHLYLVITTGGLCINSYAYFTPHLLLLGGFNKQYSFVPVKPVIGNFPGLLVSQLLLVVQIKPSEMNSHTII